MKFTFHDNELHEKYKRVFGTKLSSDMKGEILLHVSNLINLKDEYIDASIDGIDWTIDIKEKSKKIYIHNIEIPEVVDFFESLNNIIFENNVKLIIY